jgi:hypothetical protein
MKDSVEVLCVFVERCDLLQVTYVTFNSFPKLDVCFRKVALNLRFALDYITPRVHVIELCCITKPEFN